MLTVSMGLAACVPFSGAARGSDLDGKWILSVENPDHVVVATLKVKFTDEKAKSCMSGDWKVVAVISASTREKNSFPTKDALSYLIENNQLTIGRNELCDAYLWLKGPMGESSIKGDYFSFGLGGGTPRGYFSLRQAD